MLSCGGDAIVELLEHSHTFSLLMMAVLLIGKLLFTAVCFGSGAPGGTLFPQVIMGALLGGAFGGVVIRLGFADSSLIMNFIVLGIAGSFAGIVRAPVTAIVLAFELTGSLETLLSVSVVSIVAYVSANMFKVAPFYEELLSGMLSSLGELDQSDGEKKLIKRYVIQPGSRADGYQLKDLAWPEGALILTVTRAGNEIIPTGDTELMALDDLLVMMDKQSEQLLHDAVQDCVGVI
ncbi:MAG: chloride channel protein [Atopobiaceae bacterium]|nr:chloride channel protein [Atopobiaceae bacterium]